MLNDGFLDFKELMKARWQLFCLDPDLSKGSLRCSRKDFSDKMLVDSDTGQEIVSS